MKIKNQCFFIILFWIIFLASPLLANDIYVAGITTITMRTGPGVDHKIVAMLKSGSKLKLVEFKKDWSEVATSSGKKGWVLSRFLTQKIPDTFLLAQLREENKSLISKLKTIEDENKKLSDKNATLAKAQEKYDKLKDESAEFLELAKKHKMLSKQFQMQKSQIEALNNSLDSEKKFWFLSGGGVFIVGLFFGLSMRKKKKSSLL